MLKPRKNKLKEAQALLSQDQTLLKNIFKHAISSNDLKGLKVIFKGNVLDELSITLKDLLGMTIEFFRNDQYVGITEWLIMQLTTGQKKDFHDENFITVMHEAALFGANKTVSMLIKNNFSTTLKNIDGQTPLHSAVIGGNLNAIESIIKSEGTNVKIRDKSHFTALFLIALFDKNHREKIKKLFPTDAMKAKITVKQKQISVGVFCIGVDKGEYHLQSKELTKQEDIKNSPEFKYFIGMFELYKATFLVDKSIEDCAKRLKNSEEFFKSCIKACGHQNNSKFALASMNEIIRLISLNSQAHDRLEEIDLLLKKIGSFNPQASSKHYNNLSDYFLQSFDDKNAEICAEYALRYYKKIDKEQHESLLDFIHYNLAMIKINTNELSEALTFLSRIKTRDLDFADQVQVKQAIIAGELGLDVSEFLQNIHDPILKEFKILEFDCIKQSQALGRHFYQKYKLDNLKTTEHKTAYLELLVIDYIKKGMYKDAREASQNLMTIETVPSIKTLTNLLNSYIFDKKYQSGYTELKRYYKNHSGIEKHSSMTLLYSEYLLLRGIDKKTMEDQALMASLVKKIINQKNLRQRQDMSDAVHLMEAEDVLVKQSDVEAALVLLERIAKPSASVEMIKSYCYLSLRDHQKCANIIEKVGDNRLKMAFLQHLPPNLDSLDDLLSYLTPETLNEYYIQKKSKIPLAMSQDHPTISWQVKDKLYKEHSVTKIEDTEYFAVIGDVLIDKSQRDQFQQSLNKGFVSRDKCSVGIKVIGTKIFELKINGDLRLLSSIVYVNEFDQKLIIFDRCENHEGVKKILKSSNISFVHLESDSLVEDSKDVHMSRFDAFEEQIELVGDTSCIDLQIES